jgi:WD40 repeat protein
LIKLNKTENATCVDWNADCSLVLLLLNNIFIKIIDVKSKQILFEYSQPNTFIARFFIMNEIVISVLKDGIIQFINVEKQRIIETIEIQQEIKNLEFSNNGEYLIVSFEKGNFNIYKFQEQFSQVFNGQF